MNEFTDNITADYAQRINELHNQVATLAIDVRYALEQLRTAQGKPYGSVMDDCVQRAIDALERIVS